METMEAMTSRTRPINPYSATTLVYAHIVHTVSAFMPAANPTAALPFMPRPFNNRSACFAPAHTALMMLPAPYPVSTVHGWASSPHIGSRLW